MSDRIFTDEDFAEAQQYPTTLGPEYFATRRFMERFMAGWEDEHLKPLATKIADAAAEAIHEKVWDDFRDYLLSDTEVNAQGAIRKMVHETVLALLSGKQWALDRFPLTQGYDPHEIRKAVAGHIGDQVAAARIADLEAEIARLNDRLASGSGY
jgi:hypothetical protein